jgi:hypothetical protein
MTGGCFSSVSSFTPVPSFTSSFLRKQESSLFGDSIHGCLKHGKEKVK